MQQTSNFFKFPINYVQIRQFANKSTYIKNSRSSLKPIKTEIRSSKPINESRGYPDKYNRRGTVKVFDTELGINTSILRPFENDHARDGELGSYEDYYDEVANNADSFYDLYQTEEAQHQKKVKQKTMERIYFKRPKEPALVTWAAREQMYYLNTTDPDEWTPKRLSESFSVSEEGAKKLLKSHTIYSRETGNWKEKYDKKVAENWKLLESGKLPNVDPKLFEKWKEGKISSGMAQPNKNLPQVVPEMKLIKENNKPSGEFLSLIQPYLDMKSEVKCSEDKATALVTNVGSKSEDSPPRSTFSDQFHLAEDDDNIRFRGRANVTSEQFKDTLRKNYRDRVALEWVEEESSELEYKRRYDSSTNVAPVSTPEPYFYQPIKKYHQPVELTVDPDGNAYLYNPTTSYQHPIGMKNDIRDKITIPKKLRTEGALYKVDDCVYSDDGEFLYRVIIN